MVATLKTGQEFCIFGMGFDVDCMSGVLRRNVALFDGQEWNVFLV